MPVAELLFSRSFPALTNSENFFIFPKKISKKIVKNHQKHFILYLILCYNLNIFLGKQILKRGDSMAVDLGLYENEKVELEVSGDYWGEMEFLGLLEKQKSGKFWFTNERILFSTGAFGIYSKPFFIINYSDIESIEKCNIGPSFIKFIPTGIQINMKDGKKYKISVLKREKYMEFINNKIA